MAAPRGGSTPGAPASPRLASAPEGPGCEAGPGVQCQRGPGRRQQRRCCELRGKLGRGPGRLRAPAVPGKRARGERCASPGWGRPPAKASRPAWPCRRAGKGEASRGETSVTALMFSSHLGFVSGNGVPPAGLC